MNALLQTPVRTYGTAKIVDGRWLIEAEPQVLIRIKRMFAGAQQSHGTVTLLANDQTTRDLEWFAQRYPLHFGRDAGELERRARAFDQRMRVASEVLAGRYKLPPVAMALPPRAYQEQAAALGAATHNLLLADDLGLGKSVSALTLIATTRALPALIVCPTHLQLQWQREVWRFLRIRAEIVPSTKPVWPRGRIADVLIITYHKLSWWRSMLAGVYKFVCFDECQELRHCGSAFQQSAKYAAAEHVAHAAEYRLGLSATPIYNYGSEFWSVLEILAPGELGTREEFLREWCTSTGRTGRELIHDPKAFGAYLRETGLMLRRTKSDVGRELPALTRIVQEVGCDLHELDKIQASAVELAKILLAQTGHTSLEKRNAAGELDWKLRQATGIAKAPHVAEFVRLLIEAEDAPVVLFGWHRAVYDIWLEQLEQFKPELYTGSESPTQKQTAIERFVRGDARVLIMSLRSGSGVDGLQQVCSRVVIGELDWSPGAVEQCIGRVHRDGQDAPVFAYYLVTNDGADPVMQDTLGIKAGQIEGVRDPEHDLVVPKEIDPEHMKKLARAYLERAR